MTYEKLNKKDGQVLTEADLLHMEDGIYNSSVTLSEHLENHPSAEHTHEEFKKIDQLEKDVDKLEEDMDNHDHDEFDIIKDHIENHPSVDLNGIGTSFIGPNEPPNRDVIWVDTDDEEIDVMLSESEILDEFKYTLSSMRNEIENANYILKYDLDAGYFGGIEPGTKINTFGYNSPLIQFNGEWILDNNSGHTTGFAKHSNNPGDTFKFTFDGTGFKLYGLCSTNSGVANVYIDGEKYEFDTYCDFDAYKFCYCSRVMIEDGVHTVVVEVADVKNFESTDYTISLDKVEIINGDIILPPAEANDAPVEDEEDEEESPFPNSTSNKFEGTIGSLKLKRGYKNDFLEMPLSEGELAFCIDTDELYIGNNGIKKLLAKAGGGSGGSGGGSLTGKYVELESTSGKKYRIGVTNDGDFEIWDSAVDTAAEPEKGEASRFKGLVINHVYGGGKSNANKSVVSHSYIELYNTTKVALNLKGLSIQYAGNNEEWSVLSLRGIVKPNHSFLIRCSQVSDPNRPQVRHVIDKYDMHWEKELTENGMKVYLCIGEEPCKYTNPFNINGAGMKDEGYIDLFAVGGRNQMFTIDACETAYIHALDINHSAHRIDFADTDKGHLDIEAIDMTIAPSSIYKPRSTKYGKWDVHYNKLMLDEFIPMMINMCYGYDAHTTRTFTWQTKHPITNYLQYRKVGTSKWTIKECDNKAITHPDTDATVHSVIINNLEPGKYQYRAGAEGRWTDIYEFEVKVPTNSDTIKFIQTGDQQGWNKYEYDTWGIISKIIEDREDFDFYINVGDISQNGGSRAFEWRYYYDMAKQGLYTRPHMTTVGNNDLTMDDEGNKTDPTAFTYYSTVENSEYISCYSWNYGYCHFISLNSNVFSLNSEITKQQIDWLRRDMAKPENKKRWTIVYMHEAPYTQTRSSILVPFIDVFAKIGVDLVLCGHHHRYTRSKRMGALGPNGENRQSPTGFYTVMGQATGFKLAGKSPTASNNHEWLEVYNDNKIPMYIHWEITYDNIKMNCYRVEDLVPYEENIGKTPRVTPFDEGFVITKDS